MCSIAYGNNVEKMLGTMSHRAPDDSGVVGKLGMGRLAIIDLKSPNLCPFTEENWTVVFNGEIFNYLEIREVLERLGHKFKTKSDTEVLFRAYREWGAGCLDRFNGMFAFAISDGKTLFLARDLAGEKPLYYTENPFEFASENKALNFKGKEFPPAHYGIYDGKLTIKRWWNFKPREIEIENAAEKLEELLADAVKIRTRTDVPYGLYYSGGVDSSLISTFHDFKHKFTYRDGEYEEEFKRVFPKILWHLDAPTNHFSVFALWKLAEMASKKVKVILSGEGADELFGGYIRYMPQELNHQAQQYFPSYKEMFRYEKDVNQQGWDEFNGNMRELLRMGDRMASAFGLENRCPFLDRRVVEFAFSLKTTYKIRGFETKRILKEILAKRNPQYKDIEKTGLFCNINQWIGSSDGFGKKDYLKYQEEIWKGFQF